MRIYMDKKKLSLLIVDSDLVSLNRLNEALENDYDTYIASTFSDAMGSLLRYPTTEVILVGTHLNSPEIGSFTHKAIELNKDVCVFVMTSDSPSEKMEQFCQTVGAEAVFYKPFALEQLHLRLEKYLPIKR